MKLFFPVFGGQFSSAQTKIFQGLREGKSFSSIADDLEALGGDISRAKAEFWIRDQSSKFFGTLTKLEQTEAGIPGYIWKITGYHTRDQHSKLAGTFHSWDKRPKILYGTRTIEAHPGEDYNCRCWAEPAFGDEENLKPWKDEWVKQEDVFSSKNVFENKTSGSTKTSINQVMQSIDSVHDFKQTNPCPITQFNAPKSSTGGKFLYTVTNKAQKISINKGIPEFLELNTAHEIGHFVDLEILGQKGKFFSDSALMDEFYQAIEETTPVQNMREILRSKIYKGEKLTRKTQNYFLYLLNKKELWARAYSQYIGQKSGNLKIIEQIKKVLTSGSREYRFSQWEENMFNKLIPVIDNIFRKEGLLK